MYLPSVLRPLAVADPAVPGLDALAEVPFAVLRGRPGTYAAERLAGLVQGWGRLDRCVWLRAGHRVADHRADDVAPALAAACRYRRRPDPDSDAALDSSPAGQLEDELLAAPEGAVLVLELGGRGLPAATRLARRLRPVLVERRATLVAVEETRFTLPWQRTGGSVQHAALLLGPAPTDGLDPEALRRNDLRRHPAVLLDVLAAARLWSPELVGAAIGPARRLPELLDLLTAELVGRLDPAARAALAVAVTTGYWHPQLGLAPVTAEQLRPWLIPLEQGWGWVRPIWLPALRRALARIPATAAVAAASAPIRSAATTPAPTVPASVPASAPGLASASVPASRPSTAPSLLQARLLGGFEVRVDGVPVESWKGQRGIGVLRYLLARDRHACSRDELLEEFWPDVPAAAARNRLQVAVSGLRRALAEVTRVNMVEFADGSYRISPALRVEVDSIRFEQLVRAAGAAERAGDAAAARSGYREAAALYRGDFAADAPFEPWTLFPRESLRIRLVDALDRLSRIELADRRLDDCIATAHRMLEVDPCREDAHRLLMRCYAEQGRTYRALQQYEFCTRVLRATVDTGPAAETRRLRDVIRTGSH